MRSGFVLCFHYLKDWGRSGNEMETDMDGVEKLLAIEEIKLVKARRCRAVDDKDWDLYRDCHTPDAKSYALGSDADPIIGNENMTESVRRATAGRTTVHHVHTPEIEILTDTTAKGFWAMEDILWWEEDGVGKCIHGYGRYFETYEKHRGRWLISSRRLARSRIDSGASELPDVRTAKI